MPNQIYRLKSAMSDKPSPINPTDNNARNLSVSLITQARFCALAVLDPKTNHPHVTRIVLGTDPSGKILSLVSDLAFHTSALHQNPNCSLLIGEPKTTGDPLIHPRITLQCNAQFLPRTHPDFIGTRTHYLAQHPKAKLYIDFADFNFVLFTIQSANLNGGFGKAFKLTAQDCTPSV